MFILSLVTGSQVLKAIQVVNAARAVRRIVKDEF